MICRFRKIEFVLLWVVVFGQQNIYIARVGTTKRILRPNRLVKEPESLHSDSYPFGIISVIKDPEALHSGFYSFQILLYEQTKCLTRLQLKTNTRNINALAIENSYTQPQHQFPHN